MVKLENIKVAVRVRPFNTREKTKGCRQTISMVDNATFVSNPHDKMCPPRQFTYDFSYWSHDGFEEAEDGYLKSRDGCTYVDQKQLFDDLGVGLLESAWSGYNCTLFAYGQTGSGKTYSMLGYGPNKGMVPMLCERMFEDISSKGQHTGVICQVSFSMFEIYNEKVYDLLHSDDDNHHSLPVRMTAKHGFCGLQSYPVSSYKEIEHYIEECNKNRTVAVTKMNENSSRAHTIVTISFQQNYLQENRTRMSKINMVDLAGSERASQTGATGVRFEESKHINQSLMSLGVVIKNLCALASGRSDQGPTPYRDSKLTMLLKDAVGGNCKTVMVANISPADQDYEQTLSTLRYASRVKSIKNKIIANVTKTDQFIKELLEEKEALLDKLNERRRSSIGYTEEELKMLKEKQMAEIQQLKSEMINAEKAWQTKLKETRRLMEEQIAKERNLAKERADVPHLWNLNEDPALTGKIVHLIKPGCVTTIGNAKALNPPTIELHGPSIVPEHGVIQNNITSISIKPVNGQIKINGTSITRQTTLTHQDRIFFSANNVFVFNNPMEERRLQQSGKVMKAITFEMAQHEIAEHSSVKSGLEWLREEVAETLILTYEANAISTELGQGITFEPVIVPALVLGDKTKRSKVFIRVDTAEGGQFLWGKNHFQDRYDLMMEIYRKYESGEQDWLPETKTQNPFWEPLDTPTLIGVAIVPLESLAYMLDIEEQMIGIYDYQARLVGHLGVSLIPCTEHGDEMSDELSVEDPKELLHQDIAFKVKINSSIGIPKRYKSSWCHYTFHTEQNPVYSDEVSGVVPKYSSDHLHHIGSVSDKTIEYLAESSLLIELHGRQKRTDDTRRGSTMDAFAISDKRRLSCSTNLAKDNVCTPCSSALSSFVQQSVSGILLEESSDSEDEHHKDDDKGNECFPYSTSVSSKRTSVTSGNTGGPNNFQIPDILLNSCENDLDRLSPSLVEVRNGIASVMKEVLKRDGLS